MKILLADDDQELVDLLRYAFKRDGHTPVLAYDGDVAWRVFASEQPNVVILDLNMPKRSGLNVLAEIRRHSQVPVLMLTGIGDEDNLVNALKAGADDYLVKPFRPRELKARIEALLRRSQSTHPHQAAPGAPLRCGNLTLDPRRRAVTIADRPVRLTRNEFALLHYLMLNRETVVNVSNIIMHVWGYDADESEDIVKMTVSRLRRKIEPDPAHPSYIKTVHGVGYVVEETP